MSKKVKYKVVIPTYKRWDIICKSCVNDIAVNNDVHVVSLKEDKSKYKKVLSSKIRYVEIPPKYEGNLWRKRNWVLDNLFEGDDDFLIMMDDDIKNYVWAAGPTGEYVRNEDLKYVFLETYEMCLVFNSFVFGFNNNTGFKNMVGARKTPVMQNNLFSEICIGYRKGFELRYDESYYIRGDIDLLCRALYRYGKILKNCLYSPNMVVRNAEGKGGLRKVSNIGYLKKDNDKLLSKYGDFVKQYFHNLKSRSYK